MSKITIFTTNSCAYCAMVKKFLDYKHQAYEVINLDDNPTIREELLHKTGAMTVPITQIGDKFVIGYNLPQLSAALAL